jgi:hypothetical protein
MILKYQHFYVYCQHYDGNINYFIIPNLCKLIVIYIMVTKTNSPLPVEVEAGAGFFWRSCSFISQALLHIINRSLRDFSENKFCNFVAEKTKTQYFCGCSGRQTLSYCGGSNISGEI